MTPRLRSTSAILVAFAVPLGVYVASLRGDVSFWDTGDLQTVPYILGIPYPTGFPGFVLLGWAWSHLVPAGIVAWRMNLLTAVASATTVGCLVALLVAAGTAEPLALAAGAAFAFANLPWNHATYVDVHPISFAAVALALVFAVRWQRDGSLRDAAGVAIAAVAALALDNTTVLAVPGIAIVVAGRRPPLRRLLLWAGAGIVALLAIYAYLPVRSTLVTAWALDPTLSLGIPPGRPFWDDGHPASFDGFVRVVTGFQFGPHRAAFGMLAPAVFRHIVTDFGPVAQRDLGETVLYVALFGGALWWWRAPLVFGGLLALGAVPLLFIFAYPAEADTSRYFLPAYFALAAFAGFGAQALSALPRVARIAAAFAGCVALAALLAGDYRQTASLFTQPTDPGASPFIDRVRLHTPPNAVVIVTWLYATPLGYGAYVEHRLDRRIVVTANPDEYLGHYRAWLATRPVVIVSDDVQHLAGFRTRELDVGSPHLYALY